MQLEIKNIGKIKSATLEFNGITVVAGNNNTGKSTIGKVLFALFSKFNNINEAIDKYKYDAIIARVFKELSTYELDDSIILGSPALIQMFKRGNYQSSQSILKFLEGLVSDKTLDFIRSNIDIMIDNSSKEIEELDVKRIKAEIISNYFNDIFDNQINNISISESAYIDLLIKNKHIKAEFIENTCTVVQDDIKLINKAIYVDDPYIIDSKIIRSTNSLRGRNEINNNLIKLLHSKEDEEQIIEQIIAKDKYAEIEEMINLVIKGQLILKKDGRYTLKNNEYPEGINVSNLSTGLKSFLIIKKLITDNLIVNRDILILDEPEIHLHPEWQIVYAELLVLLQKYFDLTILLTTHSPFFLRAIEVFSKKYELNQKCKYYLSKIGINSLITFSEVENTTEIYQKMANTFSILNNISDELDYN
ncbi:MAG: AAA family ATPase [Veillonella sp.]|uniref:AAA family ATPase n=1 Tax=Veillonella sp. TaxID=1926307 RepID=UPI0028FF337A|nr:AAA family ATPase [Veillonella sp.]MDU2061995.1 AAA family ATPase [Veillonella sp.]MDU2101929.1 AAA family ATPase [Veillonella sp.]MDU2117060.1 AAA family ATPase [Veillonella sp.]